MTERLSFEVFRRSSAPLWGNRYATRHILPLTALMSPCGATHHSGLIAWRETKCASRQIRNQFVNRT